MPATIESLLNDDFQNRQNKTYPKSNIPTQIYDAGNGNICFSFKNTNKENAETFVRLFCLRYDITFESQTFSQDGDYEDDWVSIELRKPIILA